MSVAQLIGPSAVGDLDVVIRDTFRQNYYLQLEKRQTYMDKFATYIPVDGEINRFPFNEAVVSSKVVPYGTDVQTVKPKLRYVDLFPQQFQVDGIEIPANQVNNPSFRQMLMENVEAQAIEAQFMAWRRLVTALINGDTDPYWKTYDGEQLFSQNHKVGLNANAYSNLDTTGLDLTGSNLRTIKTRMMKIPLGPNGEYMPMDGAKWKLVIPPDLQEKADIIMNPRSFKGETNIVQINANSAVVDEVVTEQLLTDPNDWYVGVEVLNLRGFVHLHQTNVEGADVFISLVSPEHILFSKMLRWYWWSVQEVFPTHFWLWYKIKNS